MAVALGRHFVILLALKCCEAAVLLMFPSTGKSHFLVFTRVAEELAQRGHKVGQVHIFFAMICSAIHTLYIALYAELKACQVFHSCLASRRFMKDFLLL